MYMSVTRHPRQAITLQQQLLVLVHVRARYGRMTQSIHMYSLDNLRFVVMSSNLLDLMQFFEMG